ncbi:MAG: ankyrin repeat domain-containing protein, partial [Bacteroidota bacterium]
DLLKSNKASTPNTESDWTFLHFCTYYNNLKLMEELLIEEKYQNSINKRSKWGRTALDIVIEQYTEEEDRELPSIKKEIVALLIEKGALIFQEKDGWTHLHAIAMDDDTAGIMEILLQRTGKSSLIDARDHLGQTPLHKAASFNRIKSIQLLIKYGADIYAQDHKKWTPLHCAITGWRHTKSMEELLKEMVKENLPEKQLIAHINAQTIRGTSPLHIATECGKIESVKLLIQYGADIYAQDHKKWTPFHYAAMHGPSIMQELLNEMERENLPPKQRIAYINAQTKDGFTPSQIARQHKQEETLKLLHKYLAVLSER